MSSDVVVRTTEGAVAGLRINRPEEENRLNLAVLERLCSELRAADDNADIRAVVITGTGRTFCCGGDVKELAVGNAESYTRFGRHFAGVHLAIANLSKPVLAAVNGDARAGGMSLLSICDLAVAKDAIRFAMPEIRAGLWPIMAMVSLNRVLPRKRAFELYYLGDSFGVETARALGLINWAVPESEFEATVRERARQVAELPRQPVAIGRETFNELSRRDYADGFAYSADRLLELLTDPEVAAVLAGTRETSR